MTNVPTLHICRNCGRINFGTYCFDSQDSGEVILATWENLFTWAIAETKLNKAHLLDVMLIHRDGSYHRLYVENGRVLMEHSMWNDDESFEFVLYELYPTLTD